MQDKSTQTLADQRCSILSHEMELLKGQLSAVRQSLKTSKDKKRQLKRKVKLQPCDALFTCMCYLYDHIILEI